MDALASQRSFEEDASLPSRAHAALEALQSAIGGQVILPDLGGVRGSAEAGRSHDELPSTG